MLIGAVLRDGHSSFNGLVVLWPSLSGAGSWDPRACVVPGLSYELPSTLEMLVAVQMSVNLPKRNREQTYVSCSCGFRD